MVISCSRFAKDFDMTATFLAMNINKKVVAEYLRSDWYTIMRSISRVREVVKQMLSLSLSLGELLTAEFKFSKSLPIKLGDIRTIFSIQ